jgi:PIN domain nuclease of toxin-antitoxin system
LNQEPGSDRVQAVLDRSSISAVNLSEAADYLARVGHGQAAIVSALGGLGLDVVAFDAAMAYAAALMRPITEPFGLSLGDRACLALARRLQVPALTADRKWAAVADKVGVGVELIR